MTLAFAGDDNNAAYGLLPAASLAGMNFRIASPAAHRGEEVDEEILDSRQFAGYR